MAGREQELHRPLSGRSEGKRDEGKYGLTCRHISGETEGATSGQAKKKERKRMGRKEEPDLKRREEAIVAIVMEVCCKAKMGRG